MAEDYNEWTYCVYGGLSMRIGFKGETFKTFPRMLTLLHLKCGLYIVLTLRGNHDTLCIYPIWVTRNQGCTCIPLVFHYMHISWFNNLFIGDGICDNPFLEFALGKYHLSPTHLNVGTPHHKCHYVRLKLHCQFHQVG